MTRTVLVPTSLTREIRDKREATRKLGYIARAATVFRIDRLVVFPDPTGEDARADARTFIETVLAYAATPPYIRKDAWGKRDELEYAGLLPPLAQTPQTGSGSRDPGSLRHGIVAEVGSDDRVRVNCGLQHPLSLIIPPGMTVTEGDRVTVRVSSRRPVRAKLVDEPPPGITVTTAGLSTTLARDDAGTRIATSRHGLPLTLRRLARLAPRLQRDGMTVAFGSPGRGLPEILGADPDPPDVIDPDTNPGFDLWLNTIPNQGSDTVRTEEAMIASLAALTLTE